MDQQHLKDLLKAIVISANNCIMKGSFSGDDVHEASRVMIECALILEQIEESNEHTK